MKTKKTVYAEPPHLKKDYSDGYPAPFQGYDALMVNLMPEASIARLSGRKADTTRYFHRDYPKHRRQRHRNVALAQEQVIGVPYYIRNLGEVADNCTGHRAWEGDFWNLDQLLKDNREPHCEMDKDERARFAARIQEAWSKRLWYPSKKPTVTSADTLVRLPQLTSTFAREWLSRFAGTQKRFPEASEAEREAVLKLIWTAMRNKVSELV